MRPPAFSRESTVRSDEAQKLHHMTFFDREAVLTQIEALLRSLTMRHEALLEQHRKQTELERGELGRLVLNIWKRHQSRRAILNALANLSVQFRGRLKAASVIEQWWRLHRMRKNLRGLAHVHRRQLEAARLIQNVWRKRRSRLLLRRAAEAHRRRVQAARSIQAAWRSHRVRKQKAAHRVLCALRILRKWRIHRTRLSVLRAYETWRRRSTAASTTQRAWKSHRARQLVHLAARCHRRQTHAVLSIQIMEPPSGSGAYSPSAELRGPLDPVTCSKRIHHATAVISRVWRVHRIRVLIHNAAIRSRTARDASRRFEIAATCPSDPSPNHGARSCDNPTDQSRD
ncbi:hypothetical protein PAPYR_3893 [Paratrimastix pyriformis]|uniref:Uncharacterized protein n=1 Tax=Paratrimastix pyriformis TaxID=342808 RepID=A0ABQ8UMZ6_9EUKA|nr:hypothetical protein PAPYR_3893 [Paratrimastix pyriformis]